MSGNLFKKWLKDAVKPQVGVSIYTERPGARSLGLEELEKIAG